MKKEDLLIEVLAIVIISTALVFIIKSIFT
jgi:hypothetical protein